MRILPRRLVATLACLAVAAGVAAGCSPVFGGGAPPPAGIGPGHYPSVRAAFEAAWWGAPVSAVSYMETVVIPRESGWDPCAVNPGLGSPGACGLIQPSSAAGLLQLLGHYDLIDSIPGCTVFGFAWWQDPYCNARAGFLLSGGGHNLAPWDGPYLAVYRMAHTSRPRVLSTSGGDPHDLPFAMLDSLGRWYYVAAANLYAEALAAQVPTYSHSFSSGGCPSTAGATAPAGFPSSITQRESGGDPNAVNASSGACGPAQILPSHFGPGGGCQGMTYSECWATLWDGGAGGSNWSETGG